MELNGFAQRDRCSEDELLAELDGIGARSSTRDWMGQLVAERNSDPATSKPRVAVHVAYAVFAVAVVRGCPTASDVDLAPELVAEIEKVEENLVSCGLAYLSAERTIEHW